MKCFSGLHCFSLSLFLIVFSFGVIANEGNSQKNESSLYIIFDGSNSMWGELPDKSRKIAVAKSVFNGLDPDLLSGRDIALRLYGHRRSGDCTDTELAVPFGAAETTLGKVSEKVNAVSPRGKTPITRSLKAALDDFGDRGGDILLISDGIETCDADPCELVRSWREQNIDIRVHVVGLGLNDLARGAMQCIAEASGTKYLDANSDIELSEAIEQVGKGEPLIAGEADPQPQSTGPEFKISGADKEGRYMPVRGTVTNSKGDSFDVQSNARFVIEGGTYTLTAGVPTLNNEVFQPITQEIEVKEQGTTKIKIVVPRPAMIMTAFFANGEEIRGMGASAYQNGNKLFNVRANEEHYIMPGTYDFTAVLNKDNHLEVNATIAAGENRVIEFQAVETVRAVFRVFAAGNDKPLRQHQELLQDGEVKYKVHVWNGADVKPGIYTLRSDASLTPYQIENIEVTGGEPQTIERTVSFAAVKPLYVFKNEAPSKDLRCWIYRVDESGKDLARSKALQCDGRKVSALEGRYKVRVWSILGEFEPTEFSAVTGQTVDVLIPEK